MLEIVKPTISEPHTAVLGINRLSLANFRNYSSLRLEVGLQPVVLTGNNGAGKTNILEALSYLSPGKGLRRATLQEIDCNSAHGAWAVAATLHTPEGEVTIGTGRDAESETEKRIIKINGKTVRGHDELAKTLQVLWLTPQMDQLFNDGMGARRKFLDKLAYGFEPLHARHSNAYEQAMRERNRLLQEGYGENAWFAALEHKMAEMAVAIASCRLQTVHKLNASMQQAQTSFPLAQLWVEGWVENQLQAGQSALQVEGDFAALLARVRPEERMAGRTQYGVHKTEVKVQHVLKNIPVEQCSTGEQKALLLSIVLGQARAAEQWHTRPPLLLLDETVAHLDASRRMALFEEICAIRLQAWMTGTDASLFSGIGSRAQFLRVENGEINPL